MENSLNYCIAKKKQNFGYEVINQNIEEEF